jgi:hypothetical protein
MLGRTDCLRALGRIDWVLTVRPPSDGKSDGLIPTLNSTNATRRKQHDKKQQDECSSRQRKLLNKIAARRTQHSESSTTNAAQVNECSTVNAVQVSQMKREATTQHHHHRTCLQLQEKVAADLKKKCQCWRSQGSKSTSNCKSNALKTSKGSWRDLWRIFYVSEPTVSIISISISTSTILANNAKNKKNANCPFFFLFRIRIIQ